MSKNQIIGIIPARAGSKRIPGKNIKLLGGKPLLEWTIRAAQKARLFDDIIISTESPEIARLAEKRGGSVPFLRPKKLARDNTPGISPILYVCKRLQFKGTVVCLQPTSPFRTARDIDGCIKFFRRNKAQCVVSVSPLVREKNLTFFLKKDGTLRKNLPKKSGGQTHPGWRKVSLNGALYVAKPEWLRKTKAFLNSQTLGFLMPARRSLDIDTPEDWRQACKRMRATRG
jgi:CMP-N-acetylneuraminic acid synthetase